MLIVWRRTDTNDQQAKTLEQSSLICEQDKREVTWRGGTEGRAVTTWYRLISRVAIWLLHFAHRNGFGQLLVYFDSTWLCLCITLEIFGQSGVWYQNDLHSIACWGIAFYERYDEIAWICHAIWGLSEFLCDSLGVIAYDETGIWFIVPKSENASTICVLPFHMTPRAH